MYLTSDYIQTNPRRDRCNHMSTSPLWVKSKVKPRSREANMKIKHRNKQANIDVQRK